MRRAVAVSCLLALLLCAGCASSKPPRVLIEPPPPIPTYTWTPAPDGGACLDSAGLAALDQELEILYSRARYLHDLLLDMGAEDRP